MTDGISTSQLKIVGQQERVGDHWWFYVRDGKSTRLIQITRGALLRLRGRESDMDKLNCPEPELIPLLEHALLPIVAHKLAAGHYTDTGLLIDEGDLIR